MNIPANIVISSPSPALLPTVPGAPSGSSVYLGSFGGGLQPILEKHLGGFGKWVAGFWRPKATKVITYDPQNILEMIKEADARLAAPSAEADEDMALLDETTISDLSGKKHRTPEEAVLLAKLKGLKRIRAVWPLRMHVVTAMAAGNVFSVIQFIQSLQDEVVKSMMKEIAIFDLKKEREDVDRAREAGISVVVSLQGLKGSKFDLFLLGKMKKDQESLAHNNSKLGTLLIAEPIVGQNIDDMVAELQASGWFVETRTAASRTFIMAVRNIFEYKVAAEESPRKEDQPVRKEGAPSSRFSSSFDQRAVTTGQNLVLGFAVKCKEAGIDISSLPVVAHRNRWTGIHTLEGLADDIFANVGASLVLAETLALSLQKKTIEKITSADMQRLRSLADALLSIVVAFEFTAKKGVKPYLPYAQKMAELLKMELANRNLTAVMFALGEAWEGVKPSEKTGEDLRKISETLSLL